MQNPYYGNRGLPSTSRNDSFNSNEHILLNGTSNHEDIDKKIFTREGFYLQSIIYDYSKSPTKLAADNRGAPPGSSLPNLPIRISFANVTENWSRICFNIGRELLIFDFDEKNPALELIKSVDKRMYKGTFPSCHDINQETSQQNSCPLIVAFSAGQIQMLDPLQKDAPNSRLFNEDRSLEQSAATCIKWIPDQPTCFLVAHASGNLYVYDSDLVCASPTPNYQVLKQQQDFIVYTCKLKSARNPIYKWTVGKSSIQQFEFAKSENSEHILLAIVSQDGYLRVFNFTTMDLLHQMKSYFGGFLSVAWSPDAKLIAVGGEDDMITIYSLKEKRVICRGQGHKSWVSQVNFDPVRTVTEAEARKRKLVNFDDLEYRKYVGAKVVDPYFEMNYRIGSVSFDTSICLWEIPEDVILTPFDYSSQRQRSTAFVTAISTSINEEDTKGLIPAENKDKNKVKKKRKVFSFGVKSGKNLANAEKELNASEATRYEDYGKSLFGSTLCPRMDQVPTIEPFNCKKIAQDRLTAVCFRKNCIITVCQEGYVSCWKRPDGNNDLSNFDDSQ